MSLENLFSKLWETYATMNPQAQRIHDLLKSRGDDVRNDHIAFRTVQSDHVGIDAFARIFVEGGYKACGEYTFKEKKLKAKHYEHEHPSYPKIFISELCVRDFSSGLQECLGDLLRQIPDDFCLGTRYPYHGIAWRPISFARYQGLKDESEYAAWWSAFGFCANHFTVFVNDLKSFDSLKSLNQCLKDAGFALNTAGGEIKGSAKVYLEQSSTMADTRSVMFADGMQDIPSCYYEFAQRYPLPNGRLFQGFVASSADKIFESTDNKG